MSDVFRNHIVTSKVSCRTTSVKPTSYCNCRAALPWTMVRSLVHAAMIVLIVESIAFAVAAQKQACWPVLDTESDATLLGMFAEGFPAAPDNVDHIIVQFDCIIQPTSFGAGGIIVGVTFQHFGGGNSDPNGNAMMLLIQAKSAHDCDPQLPDNNIHGGARQETTSWFVCDAAATGHGAAETVSIFVRYPEQLSVEDVTVDKTAYAQQRALQVVSASRTPAKSPSSSRPPSMSRTRSITKTISVSKSPSKFYTASMTSSITASKSVSMSRTQTKSPKAASTSSTIRATEQSAFSNPQRKPERIAHCNTVKSPR